MHREIDGADRILHKECATNERLAAWKLATEPGEFKEPPKCPKCGHYVDVIGPSNCKCWMNDPFRNA